MRSRFGFCCVSLVLFSMPADADDGRLVGLLDSIDLNDYALTAELYISQSPYSGVDDFAVLYPLLSNFESSVDSRDILYIRDSYAGIRYVSDAGWVAGFAGKIQTLGYGADDSEVFAGMERRNWTAQFGFNVGKRFNRLAVDLFATTDLLDEHGAEEYDLLIARAFPLGRWEIVPQIGVRYQTGNFVNHYYGVTAPEATAERPEYTPGSALTPTLRLTGSYRISPTWFLTAAVGVSSLPGQITDSPLVDRDNTWRFSVGISYDAPAFAAPDDDAVERAGAALELSTGGFLINSRSRVDLAGPSPLPEPDVEDGQRLEEQELAFPVDAIWQWGRYHRLDLRLFSLSRSSEAEFVDPVTIGDVTFGPNETVRTRLRTRVFRIGYGFSFLRDEQKELSLLAGLHVTDIEYSVRDTTDTIAASTTPVLPVFGVRGRVNMHPRISIEANVEAFLFDFNRYSGELFDVSMSGRYRLTGRWFTGLGYRYYRQNIRTADESLAGRVEIDYHGPYAYVGARF